MVHVASDSGSSIPHTLLEAKEFSESSDIQDLQNHLDREMPGEFTIPYICRHGKGPALFCFRFYDLILEVTAGTMAK